MNPVLQIVLRLVLFPITIAAICVAVPHFIFSREGINVRGTMTVVAAVSWAITCLSLIATRKPVYLMALALGSSSVLIVWGLHVLVSYETFRMHIGVPSIADFAMAALWWGSYFAIQFSTLYPLVTNSILGTTEPQTSHPGIEVAVLFGLVNIGLLVILAIVTVSTGGFHFSFPALATLNLPLQTLKDALRPVMGSGGYIPGSMILYAVFGTSFQLFLAWGVCCIAHKLGMLTPNQSEPAADDPVEIQVDGFVHDDIETLRKDAMKVSQPGSRHEDLIFPFAVLLFALYQFAICWNTSSATETPITEVLSHDSRGFHADSYSGAFVRVFDQFVTGVLALTVSIFLLLMARSARKNAKLHSRLLDGLYHRGIVRREEGVPVKSDGT